MFDIIKKNLRIWSTLALTTNENYSNGIEKSLPDNSNFLSYFKIEHNKQRQLPRVQFGKHTT